MTPPPTAGPTRWLELRVHGVHAATPQSMLGVPTEQVAGDAITGLHRPAHGVPLPERDDAATVTVEAYTWGGLTSGVSGLLGQVKRALWLLLLPFALANLAYWARLQVGGSSLQARFGQVVVRLSALVLTVFFTLTFCFVGIDLVGWQCFRGGVSACSLPGWVQVLGDVRPGLRLAVGSAVPLAAVAVLFWLTHASVARYEDTRDPSGTGVDGADPRARWVLTHPALWSGTRRTTTLRDLHVAAGLATVAGFSATHAWRMSHWTVHHPWDLLFAVVGVAVALVLGLAAVLCSLRLPDDESAPAHRQPLVQAAGWARGLLVAAVVVVLVELALLVLEPGSAYLQYRDFAWHDEWFVVLFVILTVLHLSLFTTDRLDPARWSGRRILLPPLVTTLVVVGAAWTTFAHQGVDIYSRPVLGAAGAVAVLGVGLTWWQVRSGAAHRAQAWNGAGASVFLAAAAWIALLFTTAGVTSAANLLNGEQSVARLGISSQPYGAYTSPGVPQDDVTLQGPVTLTPYAGPGTSTKTVVSARDAWLTPSYQRERRPDCPGWLPGWLRCDQAPRAPLFHVPDGYRPAGSVSIPAGSLVLDRDTGTRRLLDRTRTVSSADVEVELTDPQTSALVLPSVLVWSPIAQLLWIVLAGASLGSCYARFRRRVAAPIAAAEGDEALLTSTNHDRRPGEPATWRVARRDRPAVRRVRVSAALAHRAEQLLNRTGAITAPIALVLVGLSSTNDLVNAGNPLLSRIANLSLYAVYALSLALLALGSKVRSSEGWRKNVGIVWDLTTFWPRAAHPLSPPCYTERVVPELLTRIGWARSQGFGVILSAHSQGSLISVAALSRRADLTGIRFVSYGSQVRGLYGRMFPGVFGPGVVGYAPTTGPIGLGDPFPDLPPSGGRPAVPAYRRPAGSLADLVQVANPGAGTCWVNLFRRGDPLGFRVFSDTVGDTHDRVVLEVPVAGYGDPGPSVHGHSYYQHTPEYRALVAHWTGTDLVPPPRDPAHVVPLPEP